MKKVVIDGIKYGVRETEAVVVGHTDLTKIYLVIPPEINGVPVTTIRKEAFVGSTVHTICIPDTITYIQDRAFRNCKDLISVSEYESDNPTYRNTIICDSAFENCINLYSVNFVNEIRYVSNDAFSGCQSLTEMHAMLGTVRKNAFRGCNALEQLYLGWRAHLYNESIENSGVKSLRVYGELDCPQLLLKYIQKNEVKIYCPSNSELWDLTYMGYHININDEVFT